MGLSYALRREVDGAFERRIDRTTAVHDGGDLGAVHQGQGGFTKAHARTAFFQHDAIGDMTRRQGGATQPHAETFDAFGLGRDGGSGVAGS